MVCQICYFYLKDRNNEKLVNNKQRIGCGGAFGLLLAVTLFVQNVTRVDDWILLLLLIIEGIVCCLFELIIKRNVRLNIYDVA